MEATMSQMIEVTYTDEDGEEVSVELPHRMEVCGRCKGHGTHLNPSIGQHAYSAEEFCEAFDEEERAEYFKRGGIYDVTCEECHGRNVVAVPDEEAIARDPVLKAHLEAYEAHCDEIARDEAEDRMTRWYEDGCPSD